MKGKKIKKEAKKIVIKMETGETYIFGERGKDGLRPVTVNLGKTNSDLQIYPHIRGIPLMVERCAFGFSAHLEKEKIKVGVPLCIGFTPTDQLHRNPSWYGGDFWIPDPHNKEHVQVLRAGTVEYR